MREEIYKCDRCGKKIENEKSCYSSHYAPYAVSARIQLWGVGVTRTGGGQRIDLCEVCYEKFVDFLESEVEQE